jgi:hypothetical protein
MKQFDISFMCSFMTYSAIYSAQALLRPWHVQPRPGLSFPQALAMAKTFGPARRHHSQHRRGMQVRPNAL